MNDNIPNRELYNTRMARTVVDKIFFLAHIDADVFIDFGCGNGEVLKAISNFNSTATYIGYDISLEMIKEARTNSPKDFIYTHLLDVVKNYVDRFKSEGKKTCLILSSVIHEIYAYSSQEEIDAFWKFVQETPFDYVAIRDMTYSHTDRKITSLEIKQLYNNLQYNKEVRDFVKVYGPLEDGINALHYLLKYRYSDNWKRELYENYFPISYSTYFNKLSNYRCIYEHRYVLPYIQRIVWDDFEIELQSPTHCQIIFERINRAED